jgi:hyaluronoglucosaminidase
MADPDLFLKGVIEGFYGRSWSWESRQGYAQYLAELGLNTYLYCPKSDACLRKRWRDDWPAPQFDALRAMGRAFTERSIYWGVGLSPFELYLDYGRTQREQLYAKVQRLRELDAPLLAVLFDDMPGALDALAERQAEIVCDIQSWLPDTRLLVCPTYYSFDPVLEKYFGARPDQYWPDLGASLPPEIDIFWTGNEVCSPQITSGDIEGIVNSLGRPVILWDNYPVNDGAVRSNYLYTTPLSGRSSAMCSMLKGHLCNPMNQALVSLPALSGLAQLYGSPPDVGIIRRFLGEELVQRLAGDSKRFENEGLSGMGEDVCSTLALEYGALPGKGAAEIAAWLRGDYNFDTDCLTD